MTKQQYQFTLGIADTTLELANALYEAIDGDIEFGMVDGAALLEFSRSSTSLREAILSAIRAVEGAKLGIRVIRVESEASATIAKINAELYETIAQE